ncbi:protein tyrosine phosphatase family protein [Ferrigenium sp. UT5]|uniref:protein tyrosine phosphatase family protein n=1 Tax=Ferrigenium sp. UT5 TaxID=3242105 RepID=UPI0035510BDB
MNEIRAYFKVGEKVATSGQPTAEQFSEIAGSGYDVVINLALPTSTHALENEASIVQSLGMAYIHIPVSWESPQLSDLQQFYEAMHQHETKKIWVHCALNMRVSCFMYLYQYCVLGLPEQQAQYPMSEIWSPTGAWAELVTAAKAL